MKNFVEVGSLDPVKNVPSDEKQKTRRNSKTGTFLRMLLICVLLTGSIATLICWHFSSKQNHTRILIEEVLKSSKKPEAGNTIFFHKSNPYTGNEYNGFKTFTTLSRRPETFRLHITPREACAIESAAINNPDQEVFLLYESPLSWVRNSDLGLVAALRNISNVNLRTLDMKQYIENSPFASLLKPIETHNFIWSKVSRFLGFLSIWRYGGTYLDLDTITLQSFDDLGLNFAAFDKEAQELSAKVFNFASAGTGHYATKNLVYKLAKILRSTCEVSDETDLESLGRDLLTSIFQSACHSKDFEKMQNRQRCFGLRVYDQNQIFGVPSFLNATNIGDFTENILENKDKWFLTYDWEYFFGEQDSDRIFWGPYALLAKKNCPRTYEYVKLYEKYIYGLTSEPEVEESTKTETLKSNKTL